MTTEISEEHIAEQVPFDDAAPEPDTKAGGSLLVAMFVLIAVLIVTALLLGGLYRSTLAETAARTASAPDFRLQQVIADNAEFLHDYREYDPVDDNAKLYQVPVAQAQRILIENPSYLAHMPGTTSNTAVPTTEIQLPVPPSLPQDNTAPAATDTDEAAAAPSTDADSVEPDAGDEEPNQ